MSLALPFERIELLGACIDTLASGDAETLGRSVAVPARLMARVLAMALAGEHSRAATHDAVDVARAVLAKLAAPAPGASRCVAGAAETTAAATGAPTVDRAAPGRLPLERLPTALLSLVCEWLSEDAVLGGLFHTSRRLRRFVCAPGSLALSTVCLTRPPREIRYLAPDVWSRLREVEILEEVVANAASVSAHLAHVAALSTRLRRLRVNEYLNTSSADPNVAVPAAVWPGLEELVLVTGCARGVRASVPTRLPALRRLAVRVHHAPRALDFLSAAARTASQLHSLVLDIDEWSADSDAALAQLAPRLESFSIATTRVIALPPLPAVKRLSVHGYNVRLGATDYPALQSLYVRNNYDLTAATASTEPWSVPQLRVLDALLGGRSLPHIVAAAPRLEQLRLSTPPGDRAAATELPHLLLRCTQKSLRRVEVVSQISGPCPPVFPWAPLDTRTVEAAVQAVLRLPLLEHFTCCECVDLTRIDWASVSPTLKSFLWCASNWTSCSRPRELPQKVEWVLARNYPYIQDSTRNWWVHPAAAVV